MMNVGMQSKCRGEEHVILGYDFGNCWGRVSIFPPVLDAPNTPVNCMEYGLRSVAMCSQSQAFLSYFYTLYVVIA